MINKYEHKYLVEAVQYLGTEESIKEVVEFIEGNVKDYYKDGQLDNNFKICEFLVNSKKYGLLFCENKIILTNDWVVKIVNFGVEDYPFFKIYNNQDFNTIYKSLN